MTYGLTQTISATLVHLLPAYIAAALLILAGIFAGVTVGSLIEALFKRLRVNDVLIATGAHRVVEKTGHTMDAGRIVGVFFKWFIILAFLDAAVAVLGLSAATVVLNALIVAYLPRIVIAGLIVFVGFVIAHRLERLTLKLAHAMHAHHASHLTALSRAGVLTLAVLGALIELHIAYEQTLILFAGVVLTGALAAGIALGLGSKDLVAKYLEANTPTKE